MKTSWVVMMVIGLGVMSAWAGRPQLDGREAPRATDLLRAEKLAEQARKRLEMPRARGGGWKRGGTKWGESRQAAKEPEERVIVNVRPPRKRKR